MARKYLITGTSSGVGLALCHHLASRGDIVCGVARSEGPLRNLEHQYPNHFSGVVLDIQNKENVFKFIESLKQNDQYPDVAILNAGVNTAEKKEPFDTEALEQNFKVNLFGTFYFVEAFFDHKNDRKVPHIATISSIASFRPKQIYVSYAASKQAINFVMDGLRMKLGGHGTQLTNIFLGPVNTPMLQKFPNKISGGMSTQKAAHLIVKAIEKGKSNAYIPPSLGAAAKIVSYLPTPIYTRLVRWTHGSGESEVDKP